MLLVKHNELLLTLHSFDNLNSEINSLKQRLKDSKDSKELSPITKSSSKNSSESSFASFFLTPHKSSTKASIIFDKLQNLDDRLTTLQEKDKEAYTLQRLERLQVKIKKANQKNYNYTSGKSIKTYNELTDIESSFDLSIFSMKNRMESIKTEDFTI